MRASLFAAMQSFLGMGNEWLDFFRDASCLANVILQYCTEYIESCHTDVVLSSANQSSLLYKNKGTLWQARTEHHCTGDLDLEPRWVTGKSLCVLCIWVGRSGKQMSKMSGRSLLPKEWMTESEQMSNYVEELERRIDWVVSRQVKIQPVPARIFLYMLAVCLQVMVYCR